MYAYASTAGRMGMCLRIPQIADDASTMSGFRAAHSRTSELVGEALARSVVRVSRPSSRAIPMRAAAAIMLLSPPSCLNRTASPPERFAPASITICTSLLSSVTTRTHTGFPAFAMAESRCCPSMSRPVLLNLIVSPVMRNLPSLMSRAMLATWAGRLLRLRLLKSSSHCSASSGVTRTHWTVGKPWLV